MNCEEISGTLLVVLEHGNKLITMLLRNMSELWNPYSVTRNVSEIPTQNKEETVRRIFNIQVKVCLEKRLKRMDETSLTFEGTYELYYLWVRTFGIRFGVFGDMTTECGKAESFCSSSADELQFGRIGVWNEQ